MHPYEHYISIKQAWEDPGLDKRTPPSRPTAATPAITQPSPLWESVKSFGSQIAEPFSGAAHYWTGGRIGSDYADDSAWIDTNKRLWNAVPGTDKAQLEYKDPLLDAGAVALGTSAALAGTAAATLGGHAAAPYAGQLMNAARSVPGAVSRFYQTPVGNAANNWLGLGPQGLRNIGTLLRDTTNPWYPLKAVATNVLRNPANLTGISRGADIFTNLLTAGYGGYSAYNSGSEALKEMQRTADPLAGLAHGAKHYAGNLFVSPLNPLLAMGSLGSHMLAPQSVSQVTDMGLLNFNPLPTQMTVDEATKYRYQPAARDAAEIALNEGRDPAFAATTAYENMGYTPQLAAAQGPIAIWESIKTDLPPGHPAIPYLDSLIAQKITPTSRIIQNMVKAIQNPELLMPPQGGK